jgi:hypothetical protein
MPKLPAAVRADDGDDLIADAVHRAALISAFGPVQSLERGDIPVDRIYRTMEYNAFPVKWKPC